MNISRHATERFVERILNIKGKNEIDTYIKANTKEIETEIRELFNQSKLIFTGIIGGGDNKEAKYYVVNDFCMILTADGNDNMKTCYKLEFPLPEDVQPMIVNSLLEHIQKSENEYNASKEQANEKLLSIDEQQHMIKLEIEELENKIKYAKSRSDLLSQEKQVINDNLKVLKSNTVNYAYQLFGNKYYKMDYK